MEGTVLVGLAGIRQRRTVRESLSQFRGRSIGTPKRGSIHDVILRQMVASAGFEDEIEIKNYDWADFILDAMIDGDVEGGAGPLPWQSWQSGS
jgi:NitT/TauT family transport system substrate-binding protein